MESIVQIKYFNASFWIAILTLPSYRGEFSYINVQPWAARILARITYTGESDLPADRARE